MGLKHLRIQVGRGFSELMQVVGRTQLFCGCETYVPNSRLAVSQLALSAAKATPPEALSPQATTAPQTSTQEALSTCAG